jgi:hypothetical protein
LRRWMLTKKHNDMPKLHVLVLLKSLFPFGVTNWTWPICLILFWCHVKLRSCKIESGLTDIIAVVFYILVQSRHLRSLGTDDACFHPSSNMQSLPHADWTASASLFAPGAGQAYIRVLAVSWCTRYSSACHMVSRFATVLSFDMCDRIVRTRA